MLPGTIARGALSFVMKTLLLAAAAVLRLQSPAAVIDCAQSVQSFNDVAAELAPAVETYSQCLNADRLDACVSESRRVQEVQDRYELAVERVRRQCPDSAIADMTGGD